MTVHQMASVTTVSACVSLAGMVLDVIAVLVLTTATAMASAATELVPVPLDGRAMTARRATTRRPSIVPCTVRMSAPTSVCQLMKATASLRVDSVTCLARGSASPLALITARNKSMPVLLLLQRLILLRLKDVG